MICAGLTAAGPWTAVADLCSWPVEEAASTAAAAVAADLGPAAVQLQIAAMETPAGRSQAVDGGDSGKSDDAVRGLEQAEVEVEVGSCSCSRSSAEEPATGRVAAGSSRRKVRP